MQRNPQKKDDSQEEVGCKEEDNGNEKYVDHSVMIEDFSSEDTLIRQSVEEAKEKDHCKEKEGINHPGIAEEVATRVTCKRFCFRFPACKRRQK